MTAKPSDILDLGSGGSLVITEDDVLVYHESERSAAKRGRTTMCGTGKRSQTTISIPLYNILYASVEDDTAIILDYADQTSPTKLSVTKLSIPCTGTLVHDFASRLLSRAYGKAKVEKRAYVLVNPHAGPGGADRVWERDVKPVFEAARMPLTVVRTTYSGEAVELVQGLDLSTFDTIIPCSGDGLPHEVFNGLAKRSDARIALATMPVAHIPCGSGNAMSCNLYGTHRPSLAALAIVKGVVTPLDLVSITQGDRRIVSFLSQALGIIAESDLATEHLRWMGGQRFTYGFIQRMFGKKVYPCDLAVKVAVQGKGEVKEHYRREKSSEGLNKMSATPKAEDSDQSATLGTPYESATDDSATSDSLPLLKYGSINDELPADWELVRHDKMGNFYCGNMAYMAPDANFFSAALANDGYMDLVCVDGDISPMTSLKLLLSVESGHFFDNPLVSYRKIEAYRIVPRDQKDGYISIDGERVPFEPFQAEIHRGLGRVLSKRGGFEAPGPRNWDSVGLSERLWA